MEDLPSASSSGQAMQLLHPLEGSGAARPQRLSGRLAPRALEGSQSSAVEDADARFCSMVAKAVSAEMCSNILRIEEQLEDVHAQLRRMEAHTAHERRLTSQHAGLIADNVSRQSIFSRGRLRISRRPDAVPEAIPECNVPLNPVQEVLEITGQESTHRAAEGGEAVENESSGVGPKMANFRSIMGHISVVEKVLTQNYLSGHNGRIVALGWLGHLRPLRRIVRSPLFNNISLIVMSAYVLLLVVFVNNGGFLVGWTQVGVIEFVAFLVLSVYFTVELLLRVVTFGLLNLIKIEGAWFWIDLFSTACNWYDLLIVWSLVPYAVLTLLPRTMRIARIFRALAYKPELNFMMRCMVRTLPTMFWAFILVVFSLLVGGLMFTQWMLDYKEELPDSDELHIAISQSFISVQATMMTLYQCVTGGTDWGDIYSVVVSAGFLPGFFFVAFIVFFQVSALNIITSIFVNKGIEVTDDMEEERFEEARSITSIVQNTLLARRSVMQSTP